MGPFNLAKALPASVSLTESLPPLSVISAQGFITQCFDLGLQHLFADAIFHVHLEGVIHGDMRVGKL